MPVLWADIEDPFVCGVMFRVGRLDERLAKAGITHLVEHLAVPLGLPPEDVNATVEEMATYFWFMAEQKSSLSMLESTLKTINDLPLGRLPRERSILRTEASGRGFHQVPLHSSLRFGTSGPGLLHYPEFGLSTATRADVQGWAARYFTRGNGVIYMTKPPPEDLKIELRDGERRTVPALKPIPYLEYPAVYPFGPDDTVGISYLVERSHTQSLLGSILEHRLRHWLRYREGITYHVGVAYAPLGATDALVTVWADTLQHNVLAVRNAFIAVLDELATHGPTEEELARERDSMDRAGRDLTQLPGRLNYLAHLELSGLPLETHEQSARDRASVTVGEISSAAARAFSSLIVVVPRDAAPIAGRFHPYPTSSPEVLEGTTFRPKKRDRNDAGRRLVISESGIMNEGGTGRSTVLYANCEACVRWNDGSLSYWSLDGFHVLVEPSEWKRGEHAVEQLREAAVDATLAIDGDRDPPPFEDPSLLKAIAAYERQDWQVAVDEFDEGLRNTPNEPLAWQMLAYAHNNLGNDHGAIEAARHALELDDDDAWTPRFLTERLLDTRQFAEAEVMAHEAIRRAPADLETLTVAVDAFAKRGRDEEARPLAERAVELFPQESRAWFCLGWAAQCGSDWDEAERALTEAVKLAPDDSMWHNNLGWVLLSRGKGTDAAREIDRALKLDPSNEFAQRNRLSALAFTGHLEEATGLRSEQLRTELEQAEESARAAPNDPVLLSRHAEMLGYGNRLDEALSAAKAAANLDETLERAKAVAELYGLLGDYDEERRLLAAARTRYGDDPALLLEQAWLGAVTTDRELVSEAATVLRSSGLDNANALMAEAYNAVADGDWTAAESRFEAINSDRPMYCCAHAWLGIVQLEQGRVEQARRKLTDAVMRVTKSCWAAEELARRLDAAA
jgi:zinc protease